MTSSVLSTLVVLFIAADLDQERARQLEASFVRSRNAIHSGEYKLAFHAISSGKLRASFTQHVVFAPGKLRIDTIRDPRPEGSGGTAMSEIETKNEKAGETRSSHIEKEIRLVVTDDIFVAYSPDVLPDGNRLAVRINHRKDRVAHSLDLYDPHLLGCIPCTFMQYHAYDFKNYWERKDRNLQQIGEEIVRGHKCVRLNWRREDGVISRCWFSSESPFDVVQTETQSEVKGDVLIDRTENEYDSAADSANGLSLPSHIKFSRHHGSRLIREEDTEISIVHLNGDIDDKVFTLAGLGIAPGTSILDKTEKVVKDRVGAKWDGNSIVPLQMEDIPQPKATNAEERGEQHPQKKTTAQLLILGNIGALTVLVLAIILRRALGRRGH